ncbi:glycosyltransferase family 2 protein [Candidatus Nitrosarchaeum limnium]|nr:glycosyltransferase [Candidatus Nitrosarchaeum limnium]
MPANKAETFIERSVQSILNQSYKNWELIIIYDDNVDYFSILKNQGITDERIKFVSTNKLGISTARNIGIEIASGNIIAILDADDEFDSEKLKCCVPLTQKNYLVSCALEIRDVNGNNLKYVGNKEQGILQSSRYKNVNYSADNMILFDKTKIPCYYDEKLSCMEDLEFMLNCFEIIDHTYHFSIPLHKYYKRFNSVSNNSQSCNKFLIAKKILLQRLENNFYKFQEKKLENNMINFLQTSINSELLFQQALTDDPKILFENIIEPLL